MAATTGTKTPEKATSKPLTPAQTAKPYGTAAKEKAARTPAPKVADGVAEPAAETAKNDVVKAIEKLETRVKAVYA